MVQKVIIGAIFTIFAGILTVGAVNRTAAKLESTAAEPQRLFEQSGAVDGNSTEHGANQQANKASQGNGSGDGVGKNRAPNFESAESNGRSASDGNRKGQKESSPIQSGFDLAAFEGIVVQVSDESLTLETGHESPLILEGRAWRYSQEMGFYPTIGETLALKGFYESGELKITVIENTSTGTRVLLRETTGRPAWAGGGNSSKDL